MTAGFRSNGEAVGIAPFDAGGRPKGGTTVALTGARQSGGDAGALITGLPKGGTKGALTGLPKGETSGAAGVARTEGAGVELVIGRAVEGDASTVGALVTTRVPIDVAALVGPADLVGKAGFVVTLDIVGASDGCDTKFLTIRALEC